MSSEEEPQAGPTALYTACANGQVSAVRQLLADGAKWQTSTINHPLNIACERGYEEIVRLLLASAPPEKLSISKLRNPSSHAAHHRVIRSAFRSAFYYGHPGIMRLLLAHDQCAADPGDLSSRGSSCVCVMLHNAAEKGSVELASILLDAGASSNIIGCSGPPICRAACYGHAEMVRLLLFNGAQPDYQDRHSFSDKEYHALDDLCTSLSWDQKVAPVVTARLLLDAGAKVSLSKTPKSECDPALMRLLVAAGLSESTLLHWAIIRNDLIGLEFVQVALQTQPWLAVGRLARTISSEMHQCTALHVAAEHGNEPAARLLLEAGANVNTLDAESKAPLQIACCAGHESVVRLLLQCGAVAQFTLSSWIRLDCKALQLKPTICDLLIQHNCSLRHVCERHSRPQQPLTLLEQALRTVHRYRSVYPAERSALELPRALAARILCGLPVAPVRDRFSKYPRDKLPFLYSIVFLHNDSLMRAALRSPNFVADINSRCGAEGRTALHVAVECGHTSIVWQLLQQRQLCVNVRDGRQKTPLFLACEQGRADLVAMLLQHSAIALDLPSDMRVTPLAVACQDGYEEVVKLLLANGANCDAASCPDGATPLLKACMHGREAVVRLLLAYGARIDAVTRKGETALVLALRGPAGAQLLPLLFEAGCSLQSERGYPSPLAIAYLAQQHSIVHQLLAYGAELSSLVFFIDAQNADPELQLLLLQPRDPVSLLVQVTRFINRYRELFEPDLRSLQLPSELAARIVRGITVPLPDVTRVLNSFANGLSRVRAVSAQIGTPLQALHNELPVRIVSGVVVRRPDVMKMMAMITTAVRQLQAIAVQIE